MHDVSQNIILVRVKIFCQSCGNSEFSYLKFTLDEVLIKKLKFSRSSPTWTSFEVSSVIIEVILRFHDLKSNFC